MDLIRILCAWLCEHIYRLIAGLYDLFINISKVELLTSEQIQPIYQRITMILTIVMVFYVTFEAVKFVIQPEQFSDKEKGAQKIVIKMVLVVILIAFVPKIFSGAYWVQNKIFDTQVFSKVILGKQNVDTDQFGKNLSYNIFSMFYGLDTNYFSEDKLKSAKCDNIPCNQVVLMNYNQLRNEGKLTFLTEGLNATGKTTDPNTGETFKKYYINFNGLFAVGVGAFIAYMLLLYCVDAGVRVVQLLFLQIIAPIPIMGYLSPKKDGMFEKWTKQCITTYLDLFIRVGIIYFILLICQILGNAFTNGELVNGVSEDGSWLIYVALIMGLLLFAHKAPKMLGELFPKMGAASGNFGLKATERVAPEAARIAGAAVGGVARSAVGAVGLAVNRYRRNKDNNQESILTSKGREQRRKRRANREAQREAARDDRNAQTANARREKYDDKIAEQKQKVKDAKEARDRLNANPRATAAERQAAESRLKQEASAYRELVAKRDGTDKQKGELGKKVQAARREVTSAQQELERARATGTQEQVQAAQQKLNNAENTLKDATEKYTSHVQRHTKGGTGETSASLMEAKEKLDAATRGITEAKAQKEEAKKKVDELKAKGASESEILAAEDKVKEADKGIKVAEAKAEEAKAKLETQRDRFNTVRTGNTEVTARNLETANQQVAKDQNERYASVGAAVLTGAIGGAARGVMSGAQAKQINEIYTKALKEGVQKEVKRTRAIEQYLDAGGANGITGFVDRTQSSIAQNVLGIDTAYQRIMDSTKPIEENIKEIDARMELAKDVTSTIGAAEDRAKSKVYDLQTSVAGVVTDATTGRQTTKSIKTGIAANGGFADVTGCATLGDVVRKYDAEAEVAKNEAESATRRLDEARANAAAGGTAVPAGLEEEVRQKSIAAQQAKYAAEQVRKNVARDEITQILQHPNPESVGKAFDQGTVQKVIALRRSLELAASNPELRERIRQELMKFSNGPQLYTSFVTGNITSFGDLDDINTAYLNVTSAYERDKRDAAERKREIETGSVAQAQKAAQDYNGNSGK